MLGKTIRSKLKSLAMWLKVRRKTLTDLTNSARDIQADLKIAHLQDLHLLQQARNADAHVSRGLFVLVSIGGVLRQKQPKTSYD